MLTYFPGQLGYSVGSLLLLHWTHHIVLHLCDLQQQKEKKTQNGCTTQQYPELIYNTVSDVETDAQDLCTLVAI